jgi:hypothetical protein
MSSSSFQQAMCLWCFFLALLSLRIVEGLSIREYSERLSGMRQQRSRSTCSVLFAKLVAEDSDFWRELYEEQASEFGNDLAKEFTKEQQSRLWVEASIRREDRQLQEKEAAAATESAGFFKRSTSPRVSSTPSRAVVRRQESSFDDPWNTNTTTTTTTTAGGDNLLLIMTTSMAASTQQQPAILIVFLLCLSLSFGLTLGDESSPLFESKNIEYLFQNNDVGLLFSPKTLASASSSTTSLD